MIESQGRVGSHLPKKRLSLVENEQQAEVEMVLEEPEVEEKRMTMKGKRVTLGSWMFEAVQELMVRDKPTVEKEGIS